MRQDGQVGSCVSVSIRSNEFHNMSRQKQLLQATDATMEIYHTACQIFDDMWDKQTPLRLLGVYMSKMDTCMARQGSLFTADSYDKQSQTDKAVDLIRQRFGEKAILRACFLQRDGIAPLGGGLSKERRSGITRPLGEDEENP